MSAEAYNLCTKAQVKEYLGITVVDYDDLLDNLCDRITAFIEKYCGGRRFKEATYTNELYDGDDFERWLALINYPVTAWTKLEYNAGTTKNPDWKEFDVSDYEKYDEEGMIYFITKYDGKRNLRVTYDAGYEDLPHELVDLAVKMTAKAYETRGSKGVKSESVGAASIVWENVIEEDDKSILNIYVRKSI